MASTERNGKKYVTWYALLPIGIVISSSLLVASYTLAQSNAPKRHGHNDLVTYREFASMNKNIEQIKTDVREMHIILHEREIK